MNATRSRSALALFLAMGATGTVSSAQDDDDVLGPRPVSGERVQEFHAANPARFKDVPDVLVLPGLVANRKEGRDTTYQAYITTFSASGLRKNRFS